MCPFWDSCEGEGKVVPVPKQYAMKMYIGPIRTKIKISQQHLAKFSNSKFNRNYFSVIGDEASGWT